MSKKKADDWDSTIAELIELQKAATEALKKYKDRTKEVFGCADGEPINLVQLAMIVRGLAQ